MESESKIDRLAYSWHIFSHTQELIKLADYKIRYLFLVSSISATFILRDSAILDNLDVFKILFIISFMAFLTFASLTIKPRVTKSKNSPTLIYHKDILFKGDRNEYAKSFKETSDQELEDDLLYQIYEISAIAESKYKYYNYSFYAMCVQIVLFFIVLV
ncbi:MAG: hypothetical protein CL670_09940 [Balneola sp.]|mgnify:CR=1 FL=1|jgi:hypothetical protein|nr:hypothetical protein [Balneola sp.]MBE79464.1 hypothetical protein [Balneola sp.]|tara:strand:+ start:592 stop:1068 length:477 start_codon:yes stop_codon:yes gene_type:complete